MKSASRASRSFTLVEILAATAILSIMFTIMFGILQQTSNGWQAANRRVEASQAARLALEQIAYDLENCVVVRRVGQPVPGLAGQTGNQALTNLAYGFAFWNTPPARPTDILGRNWVAQDISQPNDMIFVVTPRRNSLPNAGEDLQETGYVPVWVTRTAQGTPGYGNVRIGRYALLRHFPTTNLVQTTGGQRITNLVPMNDFTTNALRWEETPGIEDPNSKNFIPIVDNCVGFDIKFSYTNNTGERFTGISSWGRPNLTADAPVGERWHNNNNNQNNPPRIDGLPQSATITMCVLDERTAERIYRLQTNGLSVAQISNLVAAVTNPASFESIPDNPPGIRATLRQGMIGFQREVFFKNSGP
jgi:type II secretory pathway pseudopilin PulG